MTKIPITKHALDRFRRRWRDTDSLDDHALTEHLRNSLAAAKVAGDCFVVAGGDFYPFSFMGRDGYIVVKEDEVVTVLPTEYCAEIERFRHDEGSQAKA